MKVEEDENKQQQAGSLPTEPDTTYKTIRYKKKQQK